MVVQAGPVLARHRVLIVTSEIGLLALLGAALQGASFVDQVHTSASMAMAILTGVAIVAYGASLYLVSSPLQAPA